MCVRKRTRVTPQITVIAYVDDSMKTWEMVKGDIGIKGQAWGVLNWLLNAVYLLITKYLFMITNLTLTITSGKNKYMNTTALTLAWSFRLHV